MKRLPTALTAALALVLAAACTPQEQRPAGELKVLISVDMEGIAGAVHSEEMSRTGKDYDYFRAIMTEEANAAIDGALAAGATHIVVRDAHGSGRNILPDLLRTEALLLRDWTGGPLSMVEGIDESFHAVAFVGYHAKAGTPDAILQHTMTGGVADISINGISMPETGINALLAGHYGVPVVFVAGDQAICDEALEILGKVECVATKQGIGDLQSAALSLHPEVAREKIRAGVEEAIRARGEHSPYRLEAPYTMVLQLRNPERVEQAATYPGAVRTGEMELTYTSDDLLDVITAFARMR
jgi:D-amino peptidase